MSMLLIPGFMLDADLWRDVTPALYAAYGPIVHADLSRDGTIGDMARHVLEDAPDEFILVGFSMGGYVAREIVRQAPQRVEALVLIATSARGDTDVQRQRKEAVAHKPDSVSFKGLSTAAVASSLHPDHAGRLDLIERIQAMGKRLGSDVFRRQSLLERVDERHLLGEISRPCLILAGEKDNLRSRKEAQELHDGITGSTLQVIEKTGHMIPLEAPHALTSVMAQWLDGLEA